MSDERELNSNERERWLEEMLAALGREEAGREVTDDEACAEAERDDGECREAGQE